MPIITNTNPGNMIADGVYLDLVPPTPAPFSGPATGLIVIDGGANDGPVNSPQVFSTAQSLFAVFGNDTVSANSLAREALSAMPEGQQFIGNRVTDGTDTSATITITDASAGVVATLTRKNTGSFANGASATLTLQSGTMAASPVVQVAIPYPLAVQEVYANIVAYATVGGGYDAAVFQPNLVAAINVGSAKGAPSPRWTASAGASTLPPQVATFAASGGTDGTSTLNSADLIGTDGLTGRTGIYACRGLCSGAPLVVAGLTDATKGQTLVTFASEENCIALLAFPTGTTTTAAIAARQANDLVSPNLLLCSDWDTTYDVISAKTTNVSPMGKIAGLIAAQPDYQYPGNQQVSGAIGMLGTERIVGGISTISAAEAAVREQSGIMYLGFMPRALTGPQLGLPHAVTSDGVTILSDVRMLKSISSVLQQRLGAVVGTMMSSTPGATFGQPAFGIARDTMDAYFQGLLAGPPQKISAYQVLLDSTNNSVASVQGGFLIASVLVTTLSAAQFIVAALQVGKTVQIQISNAA